MTEVSNNLPPKKKMKRWQKVLTIIGCTILYLGAIILINMSAYEPEHSLNVGEKVPEIECVVKGKQEKFNIKNYLGKKVVINFWGTWCGGCVAEMPDFNEAKVELGEDVYIIALADQSSCNTYENYVDKHWSDYVIDFGLDEYDKYYAYTGGGQSYPKTIIVNTDGTLSSKSQSLYKDRLIELIKEAH